MESEEKTPGEIREDLVVTAVKFLQNVKVVGSPWEIKRNFLVKKGLTEAEIDAAFTRIKSMMISTPPPPPQLHHYPLFPSNSISSKIRDFLNILLLLGGFSYSIRYLWKKYIRVWLFGSIQQEKSPHEKLMETSNIILSSVDTLKKSMITLESSIERYSAKLDQVTEQIKQVNADASNGKNEIKSELQSVKGILLSSRSFPARPVSLSPPSIPSWQIAEDETSRDSVGPDIIDKTDIADKKGEVSIEDPGRKEEQSGSNSSSLELLNADSPENSGEDTP